MPSPLLNAVLSPGTAAALYRTALKFVRVELPGRSVGATAATSAYDLLLLVDAEAGEIVALDKGAAEHLRCTRVAKHPLQRWQWVRQIGGARGVHHCACKGRAV